MSRTPALVLLGCLLIGTIAAEVSFGIGSHPPGAPVDAKGPARIALPKTSVPQQRPIAQWVAVALGRPLFAPDRRPAANAVTADVGLPRLTGIIRSPGEAVAIFQPADKGKPVLARFGDMVGGWKVAAISANVVDLRKASDRLVLTPTFGEGSGVVAKEQKPPPNRWEVPAASGILRARWSNGQLQP